MHFMSSAGGWKTERKRMHGGIGVVVAFATCAMTVNPSRSAALDSDIGFETNVSENLPSRPSLAGPEPGEKGEGGGLPFAVLPQVGYGPETGPKLGVKFDGRNLFGGATFVDVNLLGAAQRQIKTQLTVGNPRLGDFLVFGTASYYRDPSMEFFGIGNNDVGPEELSNQDLKRGRIGFTLGYRVLRRVALTVSAMYRETDVDPGKSSHSPTTQRFAPTLPGVHGGKSNYVGAALVFNSRDEVVRPTEGWTFIIKYLSADSALWNNNTDFSKLILDTSYTVPLVWRRQIIALHANTEIEFGDKKDIPFFELTSLGGDDSMRGYFPHRFLGKGRALFNAEYRLKLADFNLRKLWDVTIDGVAFGDAGRVYEDGDEFEHHFADHFRYSYGGGTRIGFSSGLVARIDVGFSPEETGLVYLTFGHTF
jgi:outer membrane protein assembly factor BamA